MKELNLKVNGMVCNGCENRIQNALKNIGGVEQVIANYATGIVTITLKEEIAESLLEKTIENIGFEIVKEIEK